MKNKKICENKYNKNIIIIMRRTVENKTKVKRKKLQKR